MEHTPMVVGTKLKTRKKKWFSDFRAHKTYYFMLIPMVVFFIFFSYLPMFGLYYAFIDYDFSKGLTSPFIGLKNFEFLFHGGMESIIWKITKNTVLYNVAFIILNNFFQIAVAILLKELTYKKFVKTTQTLMFMPYFVSMVIVSSIVYNLFNFDYGVVNGVISFLGFEKFDFYATPQVWPFIIVGIEIWKGLGYGSVIYLASIMGIDESVYEAAYVDGATKWQRILHITLPLLKPTIIVLVLFALGGIMRGQFDLFWNVVGQNGLLLNATDIIDTYVYRSLTVNFSIGLGSAAGLYQSVFGLVLILTVNAIVKKVDKDNALF
ncbi:putative aldouronate transport system permease protein [Fontibacillus phaseoli]|uniref:Putative aldouronate transport system permease protein n=1 Tax=Fontibacillus phaseoli TaxID=1416533 RepID=A0A369BIY8_9BACL|nr:ABC transporter permease subunit [Fontibacillus phaseoli]RCX21559.1 putative aldouronate transport system permease protein [Fontibacillus phaseoli]